MSLVSLFRLMLDATIVFIAVRSFLMRRKRIKINKRVDELIAESRFWADHQEYDEAKEYLDTADNVLHEHYRKSVNPLYPINELFTLKRR